jgi:hypothetical protein
MTNDFLATFLKKEGGLKWMIQMLSYRSHLECVSVSSNEMCERLQKGARDGLAAVVVRVLEGALEVVAHLHRQAAHIVEGARDSVGVSVQDDDLAELVKLDPLNYAKAFLNKTEAELTYHLMDENM